MIKKVLLLISLPVFIGCLTIRESSVTIKTPPQDEVSFRGYLKANDIEFLSPSETTTLTKVIHSQDLNRICKGLGGTFYVTKEKTFESFEGMKTVYEEVPYEQLGSYSGEILNPACKSPSGEVIFELVEMFFTGTRHDEQFATKCYLTLFRHKPEKHFNHTDGVKQIQKQQPSSLMELIRSFKGRPLPDGSFKIIPKSEEICTPFTYPKKLDVFHAYCLSKGGEFSAEYALAEHAGEYTRKLFTTKGSTKYEAVVLDLIRKFSRKDSIYSWVTVMTNYKYTCKGPETFTVRFHVADWILGLSKPYPQVEYFVMPGKHEATKNPSPTLLQPQTRTTLDPAIEKLLLDTANSKSPQSYVKGALHYTTHYNYADGSCHYISLIEQIGPSKRTTIKNYSICNGVIISLGEEEDYIFGPPDDVKEKARQIVRNCSTYGSSTLHYNGFRIDCKVLNPNQPCFVETTITKAGRLLEKQTSNACK